MSKDGSQNFTTDFVSMLRIVMWNSFGMFYMDLIIPLVSYQTLNATTTQIGFIVSIQVIGFTFSSTFVGWLTDRTSKKAWLVLIGSFGRGIAYFVIYFAILSKSLSFLGVGTFILGFGAGFFWIPLNTLIAQKSHPERRSEGYGRRENQIGLGTVIGSSIGFSIYGFGIGKGWSDAITFLPIIVYALSNFYGGIRFKYSVDETIRIQYPSEIEKYLVNQTRVSIRQVIPILFTGFGLLIAIIFIESINNSIYRPFIQIYLVSIFVDPTVVMLMYIPAGIIALFLAPKLGQLIDRVRPILGITFSILLGAGVTYLFIIISNRLIMSILLIIDTLAIGILSLCVQNFLSRISTSHRGKIMGMQSLAGNIGSMIGPIVGGRLAEIYLLSTPFYVSIFVELSLIPLYWVASSIITPLLAEKKQIEHSIEVKKNIP